MPLGADELPRNFEAATVMTLRRFSAARCWRGAIWIFPVIQTPREHGASLCGMVPPSRQ
jgi:hypothetical protein